jgi:hypothetical protein
MFKLVSAGLAGPHVPNTSLGRNDSGTALRTLRLFRQNRAMALMVAP